MSTTAEATEGQVKIRQLLTDLRYGHFDSDAIGEINSMLDQALAILDASPPIVGDPVSSPEPSVIEAGDAMENMMRRLRTQMDDEGILPTGNDFNGMDGLCAAWVAAKASRPSVTAPQGVTVDQFLGVFNDWRTKYGMPLLPEMVEDYKARLSALLTNPK